MSREDRFYRLILWLTHKIIHMEDLAIQAGNVKHILKIKYIGTHELAKVLIEEYRGIPATWTKLWEIPVCKFFSVEDVVGGLHATGFQIKHGKSATFLGVPRDKSEKRKRQRYYGEKYSVVPPKSYPAFLESLTIYREKLAV